MTTKTITKQQALDLYLGLKGVADLTGAKFAYAVARNIDKLEGEVKSLRMAYKPTDEYIAYEDKRIALAKEHSQLDSNGNPIVYNVSGGTEYKLKDEEEFDKAYSALKDEHKEVIEERQKQLDEYNEMVNDEIEVELYLIKLEYVPENITTGQLSAIFLVLDDDTSEDDVI